MLEWIKHLDNEINNPGLVLPRIHKVQNFLPPGLRLLFCFLFPCCPLKVRFSQKIVSCMSDLQFLQTFYSPYILRYIVKCLQKLEIWWATWTLLKKTYLSDENILLDLIHLVEQTVQDLKVQTNSLLRLVKEVAKLIEKYQIWFLLKMTFQFSLRLKLFVHEFDGNYVLNVPLFSGLWKTVS